MHMLRTRIAPTPSGYLHIGNAVNVLLTWAHARSVGGHITLRIDDIDPQMSKPEFVADIFRTLDWLGIDIDAGPTSVAEVETTWSQRLRLDGYNQILLDMVSAGLVFGCTCTRSAIAKQDPSGRYTGTCRHRGSPLDEGQTAWRFNNNDVAEIPYPIVRLKNGLPAYQLVSVADDVAMGMTWILRGMDLEPSTRLQRKLASQVGALAPFKDIVVDHHALVLDERGGKLSKSAGAADLRTLRSRPDGIHAVLHALATIHGCDVVDSVRDLPAVVTY
jgi:glutamyl-tRNA synthetase